MKSVKLIGEQKFRGNDVTLEEIDSLIKLSPVENEKVDPKRKIELTLALYEVSQILAKHNITIEYDEEEGYIAFDELTMEQYKINVGMDKQTNHYFNMGIV